MKKLTDLLEKANKNETYTHMIATDRRVVFIFEFIFIDRTNWFHKFYTGIVHFGVCMFVLKH